MGSIGNSSHSIQQVMRSYREGNHFSRHSARKVAEECSDALKQAQILHEISHGTIESRRLEGELNVRQLVRSDQERQRGDIESDVVDLAGVSIHVHRPSEKIRVREIIQNTFTVRWEPDMGMEMGHTEFCTEYYWVSLKEESTRQPLRVVEIQVTADPGDKPFRLQHELGSFLGKWAAIRGRHEDPGDVQPLWELVNLLNLCHPRELQRALDTLDVSTASDSDFTDRARGFKPLELSLAMYVTDSIIRLPPGIGLINETLKYWEGRPDTERQRYRMEVIRDSIIWLNHLRSWGAGAAKVLLGDLDKGMQNRQQERIAWLDHPDAKCFFDKRRNQLSADETKDLAELWRMFEEHKQVPAQYVFNLARLHVQGRTPPCWPTFRKAIVDLVYV
ncbi:hypothetical protein BDV12DRAFT_8282 [Aspergillus spectabilis]